MVLRLFSLTLRLLCACIYSVSGGGCCRFMISCFAPVFLLAWGWPLSLVRYIARLLLVLSTFMLRGGGSVAIWRYIRLIWATVMGMCMFYLWFTVGELRLPGDRVAPWRFAPR